MDNHIDNLPTPVAGQESMIGPFRFIAGLFSLMLRTASEATRIAGEIHGVINERPAPLARSQGAEPVPTPRIYQLIHLAFIHIANQLHKLIEFVPKPGFVSPEVAQLQSVMNGVFGDKLHDWGHPSAIEMQVLNRHNQATSLDQLQQQYPNGVALFCHGLCLSEYEWQRGAANAFMEALQAEGFGVAYLRYNSGLTLAENGSLLANLIHSQWQLNQDQSMLLIGHSMGGLVIRSALHQGQDIHQQPWVNQVSHAAYVASPHEGASGEKLGDFANGLLGYSPYTKPLMALGNIRSRGIRSLKNSDIKHPETLDVDNLAVFNHNIHHLLIGARLPNPMAKQILGDGLVTEVSAMGLSHFPEEHHQITRLFINEIGHLKLLRDQRLYWALTLWLKKTKHSH